MEQKQGQKEKVDRMTELVSLAVGYGIFLIGLTASIIIYYGRK